MKPLRTSRTWLWCVLLVLGLLCPAQPAQAAPRRKRAHTEQRGKRAKRTKPAREQAPAPSADIREQPDAYPRDEEPEPAPTPVRAEPPPPEQIVQTPPPPVQQTVRSSLLEFALGAGFLNRKYDYQGAAVGPAGVKPFGHTLPAGPVLVLDAGLYPFASVSSALLANLGLVAGFSQLVHDQAVFLEGTPDELHIATTVRSYDLGLRGRFVRERYQLGLRASYGSQRFDAEDGTVRGQRGALLPDIRYDLVRIAADARWQLGRTTLSGAIGTRLVLDTGSLQRDWRAVDKVRNFELSLQLAFRLTTSLDLTCGAELVRYKITFSNDLSDPALIADGAVDRYLSATLGLRLTIPVQRTPHAPSTKE